MPVRLTTVLANTQSQPHNRHASGHRSTRRPSKMDLSRRSGSLTSAPATKDVDVIDEVLAEDEEGNTGVKEHIPMSSALFRLSWISDDSDSDDPGPSEPVSLPPEKLPEPPELVIPSVTITPVAMTRSPSPSTMTSPHNTMDRGNYTKPKRRTEEGRFQNAVLRTMANLAASKEEDAENNPFQMLQKMASVILSKDEIKSIMQYVAEYMERNDVEHLVSRLLGVLNKPEKQLLLNQIRELVSPFDRGRFDSMLSVHENINFQKSDYRERFNEKGERGRRPGLKEEQSLLARVQCRRKQLDAQLELLENLKKIKPKIYKHKEEDLNLITVYVSKNIRTLGISVTGGADCKKQQAIIIEEVHSGGAAAETKRIKPGMILVSVDDEDIEAASHKAAVYTIRKAFTDRKKPYMKLVLRKTADVERWSTS